MLDGTIPVEMQDKYLNIILFETERLNKLTKSLLELNKFGSTARCWTSRISTSIIRSA